MKGAFSLLFESAFGNRLPLFGSQHGLAKELVSDEGGNYFVDEKTEPEKYGKEISKLQTYISLLINEHGNRRLKKEFIDAVISVVQKRNKGSFIITDESISEIRKRFEEYLPSPSTNYFDKIGIEYIRLRKTASYIANFSSRPIELEANPEGAQLVLRNLVIDSLIGIFEKKNKQKHRYNFPTYNTGVLFWRKMLFLLTKRILNNLDLLDLLREYLIQKNVDINEILEIEEIEKRVKMYVYTFLKLVDELMIFNVIHSRDPLFLIPYVALNPNEYHNSSIFVLLQSTHENIKFHRLDEGDVVVWRERVWDVVKANIEKNQLQRFTDCVHVSDLDLRPNLM